MKIIIVNYLSLSELPPAISLLEKVNTMGGVYISLYEEKGYSERFCNITFCSAYREGFTYDGSNGIKEKLKYKIADFNRMRATRKICHLIDTYSDKDTVVWFLHESTVLSLGKQIEKKYPHYFVTLYELDAAQEDKDGKLSSICKKADRVIVPEEMRAHIVRAFLSLPQKPYVIHNKPIFAAHSDAHMTNQEKALERIRELQDQGNYVFIYAGIFIPERRLNEIIEAFGRVENTKLLLMGRSSYYLEELKEKYPDGFDYLGFYEPPEHLKIIEAADVGVLTYVAQNRSINALFCAPNKIFEYGSYGLPVIGNDIPGLKYVIEKEKIGACFDQDSVESIEQAIKDILHNYEIYRSNIRKYVDSVDVGDEIEEVIKGHN